MSKRHHLVAALGLLGPAIALHAGCIDVVAEYYTPLTDPNLFDSGPDGDGGLPPDCLGEPNDKNVTDDCGVFAQADAPSGGDGSKTQPFTKLADAIAAAQSSGKRVYACAGAPFVEAVSISAGLEVYGGFDCANAWAWSQDARTQLNGPADAVALTIEKSAGGAQVEGFAITAASPSVMTSGGSSIAVVVDEVTATLVQCDVKAGDAADGVQGTTPADPVTPGQDAPAPVHGQMDACINPGSLVGGLPGVTMCGSADTSGGPGGKGGITGMPDGNGQMGGDGGPAPIPNPTMAGLGGVGQADLMDVTKTCQKGQDGLPGTAGGAGPGGSGTTDVLSLSGLTNTDATDGSPGTPGQGGGGGGGAKSGTFCLGGVDGNGASGGGGGAGGCAGKGGGGGKAGGSSIAIVSLGTKLTLTVVTLVTGKGGKGGGGAAGQSGGAYGNGASGGAASGTSPSTDGCKGGDGGNGGPGGTGGGGRGGHSIGIAYAKAPTAAPMVKTFTSGAPGDGGSAGAGAPMTSDGSTGAAGVCWNFMSNAVCAM